jgi:hypothetical protein
LPENCPNTASASGETCCHKPHPRKIDEFSANPPNIRKDKLEILVKELGNDPSATGYIIETFKRGTLREMIRKKISNTYLYLEKVLGMNMHRVVWQIVDGQENSTQFFIVPAGADLPDTDEKSRLIKGESFNQDLDWLYPKPKKSSSKGKKN